MSQFTLKFIGSGGNAGVEQGSVRIDFRRELPLRSLKLFRDHRFQLPYIPTGKNTHGKNADDSAATEDEVQFGGTKARSFQSTNLPSQFNTRLTRTAIKRGPEFI